MKKILLFSCALFVLGILSCKKDSSQSYIGTYAGSATDSVAGILADNIVISQGSTSSTITVSDSKNDIGGFTATVNGSSLTIPMQAQSTDSISGTGSLNGNTLTLNVTQYSIFSSGLVVDKISFTGTKQ